MPMMPFIRARQTDSLHQPIFPPRMGGSVALSYDKSGQGSYKLLTCLLLPCQAQPQFYES